MPRLIIIRSFDVNKPGEEVENLRGGEFRYPGLAIGLSRSPTGFWIWLYLLFVVERFAVVVRLFMSYF